jgi:hypothetical protein
MAPVVNLSRTIGLEQEVFLVDEEGRISHSADELLLLCRVEARRKDLDPENFKVECAKNMVEINSGPKTNLADLVAQHLGNVQLAISVGKRLGLRLYPLGTYPLPITPVIRDDLRYQIKVRTLGHERYLHAGRCAGVHLHLGLPAGAIDPYSGRPDEASRETTVELLGLYNVATALDPALVFLGRACPFYEGRAEGLANRSIHYRGRNGEGVYTHHPELGSLQPYVASAGELGKRQNIKYRAWLEAMDLAGVKRSLFFESGGTPLKTGWNPVRINRHGTVEIRTMDGNYPETFFAIASLVSSVAHRVRNERLRVTPTAGVYAFEVGEGALLVPDFQYLNGDLLDCALSEGVEHPDLAYYLDSIFAFASASGEASDAHLSRLKPSSGGYRTTEADILQRFPPPPIDLAPELGLEMVIEVCNRHEEQVGGGPVSASHAKRY